MKDLLSFHGDPAVKAFYVTRVRAHAAADRLIRGTGWEDGKGCAVGCTLESYDHSRYPIELGLPEWLARLEDSIFENLPLPDAMTWPIRFLESIPVGKNVEPVRHRLAVRRLDRLITMQTTAIGKHGNVIDNVLREVIAAIEMVKTCHLSEQDPHAHQRSAAESAESAARSAAESAESAARSAAESAESAAWSAAESAAESARSAAWSARSAARSARSAAWSARSAARSAAWQQEASDLLELLGAL